MPHGNMQANFLKQNIENSKSLHGTICMITMQLHLFQLKLKIFQFFTITITLFPRLKFSVSQIAR